MLRTYRIYNPTVRFSIYIWQVIHGLIQSNVTLPNNLLLNSYFENLIVRLHILYVLNIYAYFYANQMLCTIYSIKLSFMHYFKLQKFEFKQLINDMAINL